MHDESPNMRPVASTCSPLWRQSPSNGGDSRMTCTRDHTAAADHVRTLGVAVTGREWIGVSILGSTPGRLTDWQTPCPRGPRSVVLAD